MQGKAIPTQLYGVEGGAATRGSTPAMPGPRRKGRSICEIDVGIWPRRQSGAWWTRAAGAGRKAGSYSCTVCGCSCTSHLVKWSASRDAATLRHS